MYRQKKLASFTKGRVLDVGYAANPNPFLHGDILGMDLELAEKPDNYCSVTCFDAERLKEFSERFDTVVAGEVIEHLREPLRFIDGAYVVLNPGGRLVISTPNPYHPPLMLLEWLMIRKYYFDSGHINLFLPRFLVRLLEMYGFERVRVYSGGIAPPFFPTEIPSPRMISEYLIYVGEKAA